MDKNAIKKYAVWARRELIERVAKKAQQYGIEVNVEMDANAESINGRLLTPSEKKERQALISQIRDKGYEQVMEEVAYTWFNRFSALRFMEVNGYLPTHIRVFTDDENNFKPQILTEAIHLELDGLDMEKVYELKDADKTDELYKYLLITQCNALNAILPGMFQKIADYTELLLPDNLLREGSAIEQMITLIPEEDWKDAVQIIGWLYQYYNSEKKDEVFAALKKNVKITKENIPAATQLFTPDWIVRYMVENSLGRLWVEGHPNDELKSGWKYYLDEAEQEADVQAKLDKIREEYKNLKPEEIRCIDPCSGSGHILAYMFDVLMQIYEAYGYTSREAVASIVENNIYGLDIDERAAQLANFAVMMKARQYDRRFFSRKDDDGNLAIPQPNVYAICESKHISKECLDYFANGDAKLSREIHTLTDEMYDAKEYGSILNISAFDYDAMMKRMDEIKNEFVMTLYTLEVIDLLFPVIHVAFALSQKYDIVVTNPPYMGLRNMDTKLIDFCKFNFPTASTDLFSCFIERGFSFAKMNGFNCMVTMQSWMFLSSFEKFRINILEKKSIITLLHMDNMVMGIAFGTAATIFRNSHTVKYRGGYDYVTVKDIVNETPKTFPPNNRFSYIDAESFKCIEGQPIAYWASKQTFENFSSYKKLGEIAKPRQGVKTLNNDYFMKFWFEISQDKMGYNVTSFEDAINSRKKWFPYTKGGDFRKWYGNNDYVVNWENDGKEMKECAISQYNSVTRTITNLSFWFKTGLTWSMISSGSFSLRYVPGGFGFDARGSMMFMDSDIQFYVLGFLCSKVVNAYMDIVSPTISFEVGNISKLPVVINSEYKSHVDEIVKKNIELSKADWDAFEYSWDFSHHPLVRESSLIDAYEKWSKECDERFNELKYNEKELNSIFINIYGLQNELTSEVKEKDITVRKPDIKRDIKGLISYAVGCMFGRYSLDQEGLAYAGGEWNDEKYNTFEADKDNIIPICSDEYFEDDITGRFIKFVETVYGKDTLQANLQFIADALGGKGTSSEVIRNYFVNDFYNDHCKMYQKRPIYWLFDSGKKGGFKALIYMHRYQQDTIARMRTDYVHEQQGRYRTEISDLETRIASASKSERVKLNKELSILQDRATEIREYEEKIHHLADKMIRIDLDDGVKNNYAIFQDVLAKIK